MNWRHPKGFNQQIQWLKLNYRNPLMVVCADKYRVREYITHKLGNGYLNDLYGVYKSADEVAFDSLPNQFVLKANHGSGQIIVCTDKSKLDIPTIRKRLLSWLEKDFSAQSGEWQYKTIPRRIIAERYIEEMDSLKDYRFYCYNGEPKFVRVIFDRVKKSVCESLYTVDWDFFWGSLHFPVNEKRIKPPQKYQEMLKIASTLSKGFPFVRVDLYNPDERILFGEMTFHPGNGVNPFNPPELDETFAEPMRLWKYKAVN